jgi:hypothetical protein
MVLEPIYKKETDSSKTVRPRNVCKRKILEKTEVVVCAAA